MPVLMKVLVSNTVDDAIKHPENGITPKRVQPRATGGAAECSFWEMGGGWSTAARCQVQSSRGAWRRVGVARRGSTGLFSLCPFLHSYKILDSELFELMHQNGDYTHFYFCYRWFLLDFKRGKRWVGWWVWGQGHWEIPPPQSQWFSTLTALQNTWEAF